MAVVRGEENELQITNYKLGKTVDAQWASPRVRRGTKEGGRQIAAPTGRGGQRRAISDRPYGCGGGRADAQWASLRVRGIIRSAEGNWKGMVRTLPYGMELEITNTKYKFMMAKMWDATQFIICNL